MRMKKMEMNNPNTLHPFAFRHPETSGAKRTKPTLKSNLAITLKHLN